MSKEFKPPKPSCSIVTDDDLMNEMSMAYIKKEELEKKIESLYDLTACLEYARFLIAERDYWKQQAQQLKEDLDVILKEINDGPT